MVFSLTNSSVMSISQIIKSLLARNRLASNEVSFSHSLNDSGFVSLTILPLSSLWILSSNPEVSYDNCLSIFQIAIPFIPAKWIHHSLAACVITFFHFQSILFILFGPLRKFVEITFGDWRANLKISFPPLSNHWQVSKFFILCVEKAWIANHWSMGISLAPLVRKSLKLLTFPIW